MKQGIKQTAERRAPSVVGSWDRNAKRGNRHDTVEEEAKVKRLERVADCPQV